MGTSFIIITLTFIKRIKMIIQAQTIKSTFKCFNSLLLSVISFRCLHDAGFYVNVQEFWGNDIIHEL